MSPAHMAWYFLNVRKSPAKLQDLWGDSCSQEEAQLMPGKGKNSKKLRELQEQLHEAEKSNQLKVRSLDASRHP
eukprot:1160773-Pelagomonas_calceolata.AAC.9